MGNKMKKKNLCAFGISNACRAQSALSALQMKIQTLKQL